MKARAFWLWAGLLCGMPAASYCQTAVDLRTQSRNVDFSGASSTKPFKSGNTLPAGCQLGETFFKTDAPSGRNLYGCTAGGEWTLLGAGEYTAGTGILIAGQQISTEDAVTPMYYTGQGAPSLECRTGRDFYIDRLSMNLYFCGSDNTWQWVANADHTHTASQISEGQVGLQRGGTGSDLSQTGGAGQYLKQSSAGAAISVGPIQAADLPSHAHAANDIASGVLSLGRGGTNNSVWTAGRCVQVSADGTRLESASAACATSVFDALDETTLYIREEFPNRSTAGNQVGTHGWVPTCSSGTFGYFTTNVGDYLRGGVSLATGSTSGNSCRINIGSGGTGASWLGRLSTRAGWAGLFRFRLLSTTNVFGVVGFVASAQAPTGTERQIALQYSTPQGDTNFMFVTCDSAGNCTRQSSGVSADTGWHTLRVWSETAGEIKFSLDGGAAVSISANVSGAAMDPVFFVQTQEAGAKTMHAMRFLFRSVYVE